ncbi:MAG: hypothetical protein EOM72_14050 [Opitutae bacterium]|nr:hypothetical protein [Opitutae bacterium]
MLRIGGSALVSAGILWLLFRETGHSPQEVLRALAGIGAGVWAAYALAQVAVDAEPDLSIEGMADKVIAALAVTPGIFSAGHKGAGA